MSQRRIDSSVAAVWFIKPLAINSPVYMDHGLMRLGETEQSYKRLKNSLKCSLSMWMHESDSSPNWNRLKSLRRSVRLLAQNLFGFSKKKHGKLEMLSFGSRYAVP